MYKNSFVLILCLCSLLSISYSSKFNQNVGSSLFSDSDNLKKCWHREEIALLASRKILQDIIPSEAVVNVRSDKFIHFLVEYFKLILEVIRKLTHGKSKHIILLALSDVLGGYMNHYLLPITREAYYGGFISFESVDRLYDLFNELKTFLKTNGVTWAPPVSISLSEDSVQILPIEASHHGGNPCGGLIFLCKGRKRHTGPDITIPMPYFDNKLNPHSIAVPFRQFPLRSIDCKSSAFILVKYYIAATKCIISKTESAASLHAFNHKFYVWLEKEVLPRLNDDKWYAAFGGVLRITKTLRGAANNYIFGGNSVLNVFNVNRNGGLDKKIDENYNASDLLVTNEIPIVVHTTTETESPDLVPLAISNEDNEESTSKTTATIIIMALVIALFLWFIIGVCFICYRCLSARRKSRLQKKSQNKTDSTRSSSSISGSQYSTGMKLAKSRSKKSGKSRESAAKDSKELYCGKGEKCLGKSGRTSSGTTSVYANNSTEIKRASLVDGTEEGPFAVNNDPPELNLLKAASPDDSHWKLTKSQDFLDLQDEIQTGEHAFLTGYTDDGLPKRMSFDYDIDTTSESSIAAKRGEEESEEESEFGNNDYMSK